MIRSLPRYWWNKTATILRPTSTLGSSGGVTQTYATLGTTPIRFNPAGGGEFMGQDRIQGNNMVVAFAPLDTTIIAQDRLTMDGRSFDVQNVNNIDEASVFQKLQMLETV